MNDYVARDSASADARRDVVALVEAALRALQAHAQGDTTAEEQATEDLNVIGRGSARPWDLTFCLIFRLAETLVSRGELAGLTTLDEIAADFRRRTLGKPGDPA